MKLHVNLLSDDERRSASPVRLKKIAPAMGLTVAGLLAFWILLTLFSLSQQRSRLKSDEWTWKRMEADYRAAVQKRADLRALETRLDELQAYERARVDWFDALFDLGAHTPTNIQLLEMRVTQATALDAEHPDRTYAVRLVGRTSGPAAEPTVRAFLADLVSHPDFTNLIASATVPPGAFRNDTSPGASEADRVFEIHCAGRSRQFK